MNLERYLIKRYTDNEMIKKGYYIRIRKKNDCAKESYSIFVYYHGIKALEWSNETLSTNPAIFLPNGKNVFENKKLLARFQKIPSVVKKDMKTIETYFEFQIGNEASQKETDKQGVKIQIPFGKKQIHTKEELRDEIKEVVKKSKYINDICLSKNRNKILLFLNETKISLLELYDLMLPIIAYTSFSSELQSCELAIKNKQKSNIMIDFDTIEAVIERRIDVYINNRKEQENDYFHTKSDTNQERQKQQDFMVLFNQKEKKDVFYKTKDGKELLLYSKNTYPFELEYMLYAGTDREETDDYGIIRRSSNIKGRIDNILMDNQILHLVEIKYGTSVIGGSNGIHKHLIDLYSCLNISKNTILKELKERIKTRNEAINSIENTIEISHINYDIVCIYQTHSENKKLSKEAVRKRIIDIYDKNTNDKTEVKCSIKKEKTTHINPEYNKNPNLYAAPLLEKNIEELCQMLEKLGCTVRIFLVDDQLKYFEEYQYQN